jgi:hypothetical protein
MKNKKSEGRTIASRSIAISLPPPLAFCWSRFTHPQRAGGTSAR